MMRQLSEKLNISCTSKKSDLKILRSIRLVMILFMLAPLLSGCGRSAEEKTAFYIYDLNREYTRTVPEKYEFSTDYETGSEVTSHYVGEALQRMIDGPDKPECVGAIGTNIGSITYHIEGSIATVNFNEHYYDADTTQRTLRLAAIVRTLCQIDGITGVGVSVNHATVVDSLGQPVGILNAEMFLENDEAKINAYERTTLYLYFATIDGKQIVEVTEPVVYSSNIAMERLIVDHLIKGPNTSVDQSYIATINPSTKVLNVTSKDGICYVNLSSDFLVKPGNVSDEVVVYSIVNSITRLSNDNKVQIMIDGETEVSLGDIYLSSPFSSDYSIVSSEK